MSNAELSRSVPLAQVKKRASALTQAECQGVLLGQPDMWAFVVFECFIFTTYFIIYMLYRMRDPELFLQSQRHLQQGFGVANTLILLTSSWLVAQCVQSARANKYDLASRQLYLTMFFGALFVASKLTEWSLQIADGYTFSTNAFFSFYYFLTAIHIIHVIIGFGALIIVAYQLHSPERRSLQIIGTGATYWHMVDFLWVILFALLYVVR
jgi:nitric oxide reductase NorE protein